MSESEAHEKALSAADGSQNCVVNYVGGAIFWFTVMTTIGYGNTAPTTTGGRALIFVMGFLNILAFTTVMGHAGYILLTIIDDFFNRVGLKRFTKGIAAVLFWLAILFLWLLVIAGISYSYWHSRYARFGRDDMTLTDSYWFAFISVTTVGFGDMYIPHETARASTMFFTPLVMLIGFVLLANFLVKFTDLVVVAVSHSSKVLDENMRSVRIMKDKKRDGASYDRGKDDLCITYMKHHCLM